MLRVLLSILVGAGAGVLVLIGVVGDRSLNWLGITILVALPLVVIVRILARGTVVAPQVVEQAKQSGGLSSARVVSLRRTGMEVNDVPVYNVELLIEPRDHAPYRVIERRSIDASEMHQWLPGAHRSAVRLGREVPNIVLVDDPTPPTTVEDPQSVPVWEVDPDAKVPGMTRPLIPAGKWFRTTRRIVFVGLGALSALAVLWPARNELEVKVHALVSGEDVDSYLSGEGRAAEMLEVFTQETGVESVSEVLIYHDHVRVVAPSGPGSSKYDQYELWGGGIAEQHPAAIQPAAEEEFALAEITWDAIPQVYTACLEQHGISDEELEGGVQVAIIRRDVLADDQPTITLSATGDYDSYRLHADARGEVLEGY